MEDLMLDVSELADSDELIDEIMKRYGQDILQLAFSYVNSKEVAEDLTQDIFIKCYKSLHTYNGKSKLRTWLWRIAINTCKDYLKSWYNKRVLVSEEEPPNMSTKSDEIEEAVIQKDEDSRLVSAVMSLPIEYREVVYLYYYEELPIKEISVLIDTKENTVKTRLRKAKKLLKEGIEDQYDG
ncbi:RNA polymerase sigma-70 factor, ECF subfamily [Bacillus sp. OV322]|uniref:sigma-70 family RNA polymerase sigma factor n=1 Tax=Bacillus sp. OV322 TaxID=1882764 RepID=UPI0008ED7C6E|nr:sigma-70 family RNA polymerase sigma factor [Bacillus sp. OV322]SFC91634.1 RNA polymerase sigma-70 factor, ECF subfamily [Bacillus sp. OV322]